MSNTTAAQLVVIPCASAKREGVHAAAELYTSANFANTLRNAQAIAADMDNAKVMILSAKYGLVDLDQELASYDTKMGDAHCITVEGLAAQLAEIAPEAIDMYLPGAYRRTLAAAVELLNDDEDNEWISMNDVYEAAPGIGYQRGVVGQLGREALAA
ncbi:hypothetical protein SEA_WEST99_8 [Mycobacterium phage West99]|uniref:DUF6884 domain-containing protein n=14 Tax=Rosebushvirus TaxID=1982900 RepID=A0A109ZR65_9CAUD|nr:hypothetical protein FDI79_gp08 [Mycobacterium phage Godines]AER47240.1 hypothetical protein HEDGEROW_8 [Mycobacterium phage Hedgerow]AER48630.1 hypothetical protein ARES_8 [Mycobacterium phage Ares]AIK68782.1 hypothetical protein PBI_LIZLEMON_8 [Mycobacterium phage LizLemon]AMB17322.1 hypothetical protein SEA_GLASS_8 [Mycobacterium phage Glass]AUX82176.1 hypothetical protein SEA_HOLEINONE_8 [Mycobacterium phage Holeinone]AVE00296.1 hypothetical protein SEA_OPIA_8 [Mycobacterium phage Opia